VEFDQITILPNHCEFFIRRYVLKNIYVGNISYSATEDTIRELFEQHGKVNSVKIIIDRYTQRSKGFGFVEMEDDTEANEAIAAVNGFEFLGRNLKINEAREKRY